MDKMFTVPELKQRGWTKTLIKVFLPTHDDTCPNPKYSSAGAPMKLYKRKRVLRIEKTVKFQKAEAIAERRRLSAMKGVETKQKKMDEFLENLEIDVPVYEKEKLIELAFENFRSLDLPDAVEISDERMCVNYLRHCGTKYEQELEKIAGKTGAPDAYYEIKEMVLTAIAFEYEWLAAECERQFQAMKTKRFSQ